jgi:hypothetical protein
LDQYQQYSINFTATAASTNISFAMREDPGFLGLDDVSVATGGGPNLIVNGNFEAGPLGAQAPTGWTFLNQFGATFAGEVSAHIARRVVRESAKGTPNTPPDTPKCRNYRDLWPKRAAFVPRDAV